MSLDAANNVNINDIKGVHTNITEVESTTSDFPTPVPEPIPQTIEVNNNEAE